MLKRVKVGIPGFDKIIEGGLVSNSINLLSGGAGTGKTLFCLQFLLNGAKEFNEKGIYVSFEETEQDLKADAEAVGLSFQGMDNKIKFIHIPIDNVSGFLSRLIGEVGLFEPKRVVIDSMSALAMPMEDDFERRKQIFKLKDALKGMNCTSILISEIPSDSGLGSEMTGRCSRFDIEEFLCDSVIVLYYAGIGGSSDRAVRVVKMRKTNHARGPLPMEIGKCGIKVLKG